ncbi:hypothetical protein PHYSODRAFT_322319 [Phytophthora sojae]|uniref:Uncharacterized protein n=1 Tax=Phytophthora sojae (strain P6497) TaxID=1094619 RepID=G4YG74_PHYSP|nr:hypothetical protein PHYSODRAFT_322319 [Phytophthora sojae]EGZ28686.1 hypothetical protein PHYSODRAFT_322319 [Phytophthora sojae]|eukprot:XP_009515961.1 hypothetical protein PHYSODRAFT_322319 [Phytophthora sojae]
MHAAPGSTDQQSQGPRTSATQPGHSPSVEPAAESSQTPSAKEEPVPSTPQRLSIAKYRAAHPPKLPPAKMSEHSSSPAGEQAPRRVRNAYDDLFGSEEGEVNANPSEGDGRSPRSGHSSSRTPRSRSRSRSPPLHSFISPRSETRGSHLHPDPLRHAPPLPPRDGDDPTDPDTVSNPLDQAQRRQLEERTAPTRSNIPEALPIVNPSRRDYGFTSSEDPLKVANDWAKGLLGSYIVGPRASTTADVDERLALASAI